MNRRIRASILLGLASVAFLAILLHRALAPAMLLTRRDAFILYLPIKSFLIKALAAGRFPTWYPYDGLGVSYVGSSIAGVFHPLNVLFLFLTADQGLKWQELLAYAFAGIGAARLARRLGAPRAGQLLAATGFAASGYLLSVSDNLPYLLTAAVLPWTWLAAERIARKPDWASSSWLAGALALSVAGGDVQGAVLQAASATLIALVARRRPKLPRLRALAASAALTGMVTAPQLLPTWITFRGSDRSAGLPLHGALTWSLHPLRLLELALGSLQPRWLIINSDPLNDLLGGKEGLTWARSELLGLPLCLLALAALLRPLPRRLRTYAVLGAVAVWLALGKYGALYSLFFKVVPLWAAFRYPEKLMPLGLLPVCLLAGWGVRALVGADPRFTRALAAGFIGLLIWIALASPAQVGRFARAHASGGISFDPAKLDEISNGLRGSALLGLALLAALALLSVKGGRWTAWAAVALNAAQSLLLSGWLVGIGSRAVWLAQDSPFRQVALREQAGGSARMCWHMPFYQYTGAQIDDGEAEVLQSDLRLLAPPVGGLSGLAAVRAYFPGGDGFFQAACDVEPPCGSPCARVAGAGFGVAEREQRAALEAKGLTVVAEQRDPQALLVADSVARPFASLPAVRHVPVEEAAKAIFDPARKPGEEAILTGPGPDQPAPGGTIAVDRSRPDEIRAEARLAHPGLAVFAMACARGWSAELDGRPARLEKADGSLCAVPLPAGAHRIVLRYLPWGWPWAFGGPVLGVGLLALGRRRERRGASERPSVAARRNPP